MRRCIWRTCAACRSLGAFALVTCLTTPSTDLDSEREPARRARQACARTSSGPACSIFDVNLLSAYEHVPGTVLHDERRLVCWTSNGNLIERPGGAAEVVIDVFTHARDDLWRRSRAVQRHRHFALPTVIETAARAGLELLAVYGQRPGAILDAHVDETIHHKAVIVARPSHSPTSTGKET